MMKSLLIIIISIFCFTYVSAETVFSDDVSELVENLGSQAGGTRGHPDWNNSIFDHDPANKLLRLANGNMLEVVNCLKSKVSDTTIVEGCTHQGRSDIMKYRVGDIACYILAQIHDEQAMEIIITEMQRRRNANEDWSPIAWAIRHYDTTHYFRNMK